MRPTYVMYNGKSGDDRKVVGMATTIDEDPAFLTHVHVYPAHRGQGHGRALLRLVTRDADREHRDLMLAVHGDPDMDSHRLQNLFEEFDFYSMGDDGVTMKRKWKS